MTVGCLQIDFLEKSPIILDFRSVAENLKKGSSVKPESFAHATVFFSDVVGFTALAAESSPMQVLLVVSFLPRVKTFPETRYLARYPGSRRMPC